jgi:hypothetical protein
MTFAKPAAAALAVALAATSFASTAQADRYWKHRHHNNHHGGAVAAGAAGFFIGALAGAAASQPRYYYDDDYYYGSRSYAPAPAYYYDAPRAYYPSTGGWDRCDSNTSSAVSKPAGC